MVMRFANAIFEQLWNSRYIEYVQITASESLGVEGRAGYYDKAGALRDMVQNHLLQLLCLTAMEPPAGLDADAIRDEKVKVSENPAPNHEVKMSGSTLCVLNTVPAQSTENGCPPIATRKTSTRSRSLKLTSPFISTWTTGAGRGCRSSCESGSVCPKRATEIAIQFKAAPPVLFNAEGQTIDSNALVIRIQPDEGSSLRMSAKMPGSSLRIEPVKMDFHYGTSFGKATPEAYERLLLDAMSGDATLFARRDEVEEAWNFVDAIRAEWDKDSDDLAIYAAGTWGPTRGG